MTEEVTPLQKARMLAAAEMISRGEKHFPLECGWCHSTSTYDAHDELYTLARVMKERPGQSRATPKELKPREVLTCVACGRQTSMKAARKVRKQQISAFLKSGVDIPLTKERIK